MNTSYKPKTLDRAQFGNPILLQKAKQLSLVEIKSANIQELIKDISFTLNSKRYGVGLAATQVGHSLAISVIDIQPTTSNHSVRESFTQVIINPVYTGIGSKKPKWEGCLSLGSKNSPVFAQTKRFSKVKAEFYDENAKKHQIVLEGLPAHVFQHETDHLNGILFPMRVEDHSTWMNLSEYRKMQAKNKKA